jgi:hypothetical protein
MSKQELENSDPGKINRLLAMPIEPKKIRKSIYISNEVEDLLSILAKGKGETQVQIFLNIFFRFKDNKEDIKTDFALSSQRKPKTKLIPEGLFELMLEASTELKVSKEDALEFMVRSAYAEFEDYKRRVALALEYIIECHKHIDEMIDKTDELFNHDYEYAIVDRLYKVQVASENTIRDIKIFLNGGPPVYEVDTEL